VSSNQRRERRPMCRRFCLPDGSNTASVFTKRDVACRLRQVLACTLGCVTQFRQRLCRFQADMVSANGNGLPCFHQMRDRKFLAIAAFPLCAHWVETFRQRRSGAELRKFQGESRFRSLVNDSKSAGIEHCWAIELSSSFPFELPRLRHEHAC